MKMIINHISSFIFKTKLTLAIYRDLNNKNNIEMTESLIFKHVCNCANITKDELMNNTQSRKPKYIIPRQVAIVLIYYTLGYSQTKVEKMFNKGHPLIEHVTNSVNNNLFSDKNYRKTYEKAFKFAYSKNPLIHKHIDLSKII